MSVPDLTVVIPTLNEATALPRLLAGLSRQEGIRLEVRVADGGSTDATVEAARVAGATVVTAPRGRGAQMNAAARDAQGEFLLFLHADSAVDSPTLLRDALGALQSAIETAGHGRIAGHFPLC